MCMLRKQEKHVQWHMHRKFSLLTTLRACLVWNTYSQQTLPVMYISLCTTERVLLQCTCSLWRMEALYEKASPFLPSSNKLNCHLTVYGKNVNAYFPLQPRDTTLFLAHLALQSVVSLRIISPELRETIYLTLGIVYRILLHTKTHLKG